MNKSITNTKYVDTDYALSDNSPNAKEIPFDIFEVTIDLMDYDPWERENCAIEVMRKCEGINFRNNELEVGEFKMVVVDGMIAMRTYVDVFSKDTIY